MKWFFLVCFVAAIFCMFFWTAVIVFSVVTSRLRDMGLLRGLALFAPLLFFIWGARQMFRGFKTARLNG